MGVLGALSGLGEGVTKVGAGLIKRRSQERTAKLKLEVEEQKERRVAEATAANTLQKHRFQLEEKEAGFANDLRLEGFKQKSQGIRNAALQDAITERTRITVGGADARARLAQEGATARAQAGIAARGGLIAAQQKSYEASAGKYNAEQDRLRSIDTLAKVVSDPATPPEDRGVAQTRLNILLNKKGTAAGRSDIVVQPEVDADGVRTGATQLIDKDDPARSEVLRPVPNQDGTVAYRREKLIPPQQNGSQPQPQEVVVRTFNGTPVTKRADGKIFWQGRELKRDKRTGQAYIRKGDGKFYAVQGLTF